MLNNLSRIDKLAVKNGYLSLLIILFCYEISFGRQLDLQYSHVGLPFAVFYNPSLIYDNSGVSLGADMRYADKKNNDVRVAINVPVAKSENMGGAFSVGMLYDSYDNYQISTGFGANTKYFQFGTVFNIVHCDETEDEEERLGLLVDLAFSKEITARRIASVVFRNVLVDERTDENRYGLTLGFGGVLNPNLLLNTNFTGYIDKGKVKRTEGGASINFYIPQFILKNSVDYSMNASTGFDITRDQGKSINNKFFMNIGVSFFRKPHLAAALIGVNKNENYFAVLYNSGKEEFENNLHANLKFTKSDCGKQYFHIECGGANVDSWILHLEDGSGRVIRTFSGGNVVPQTIEWNGLDYKGDSAEDLQAIRARLVVQDKRRNVRDSETIIIRQ